MARVIGDIEIAELLSERKVIPTNWRAKMTPRQKANAAHLQAEFGVEGENGSRFKVYVRENPSGQFDFSVILQFVDSDGLSYILTRYNGKHSHTNHWEKRHGQANSLIRHDFHIHKATERYQKDDLPIDGYAEATAIYGSLDTAVRQFAGSNGFVIESTDSPGQTKMF